MSTAPVFDPAAIERMRRYGGDNLVRRMLELFFRSTPERYQTIAKASQTSDFELLRITAHSLKSSAGNLGGVRLQKLSEDLEAAAALRDHDRCRSLVADAQAIVADTLEALKEIPHSE